MTEDLLGILKAKEEEMDRRIVEARKKAAALTEEALAAAEELKACKGDEIREELEGEEAERIRAAEQISVEIEKGALKEIEEMKERASGKKGLAVKAVMEGLLGGSLD